MPSIAADELVVPPAGGGQAEGTPAVSFEFFPPTDPAMDSTLWKSIERLVPLGPRFASVTCGADGSTRDRTVALVQRIRAATPHTVVPHVTSVGMTRTELCELARDYWSSGIRHLVALRGDRPSCPEPALAMPALSGIEVVEAVRSVAHFEISVAAYPEVHPRARSARDDLEQLKRKVEAGAGRAITQFFYDNGAFLRFRDACGRAGIHVPIVPGILPINRFQQVCRFARRCGTCIPRWLDRLFAGLDEDAETSRLLGAAVMLEQIEHLRRHGVEQFHFYTLNRADLPYAACHALGLRAAGRAELGLPA
jgi:methylenetetrahydrofolate reductase (NADPH)